MPALPLLDMCGCMQSRSRSCSNLFRRPYKLPNMPAASARLDTDRMPCLAAQWVECGSTARRGLARRRKCSAGHNQARHVSRAST